MPYRTILVAIRTQEEIDRLIETAVNFGDDKRHLIVTHCEPEPVIYASPDGIAAAEYYQRIAEDSARRLESIRKAALASAKRIGVDCEWRGSIGPAGDELGSGLSSSYAADLVVAGQADPKDGVNSHSERLIFETGRPVLFVPFGAKPAKLPKTALVAWNNSREAARATFDALPLLKKAKSVEVVLVDPPTTDQQDAEDAGDEIAAALARQDVKVNVEAMPSGGSPVGTALQKRADEIGADILIMGAYGHSRLREMILGGATRQMLALMKLPTFMSR
jgi:nucleotide-binding universal stress UspA family protein